MVDNTEVLLVWGSLRLAPTITGLPFSSLFHKKARSLLKKVSIEVLISCNSFCYDVTIKLYQHHVIKRVRHTVDTCRMLLMYLMYCVVVTLLFQLLAQLSSAVFHVSDLLTSVCKHVNNLSPHYSYTTPYPNC